MNDLTFCRRLPEFDVDDWEQVRMAFEMADRRDLGQAWRSQLESRFAPATAYFGWRANALYVYIEAQDRDIYSAVNGPNQETWVLGDCLELFLGLPDSEKYYELHITPENHRLQLRFADYKTVFSGEEWTQWHVWEPLFESRTRVDTDLWQWRALLIVDLLALDPEFDGTAAPVWKYSVCRYDRTRGAKAAVLSSTSAYRNPNFHRQNEWGQLKFE